MGASSLVGSTFCAAVAYSTTDIDVGISPEALSSTRKSGFKEEKFLKNLIMGYESWINYNSSENNKIAFWFQYSVILLVLSVVYIGAGIMKYVYSLPKSTVLIITTLISLISVIVFWKSRIAESYEKIKKFLVE